MEKTEENIFIDCEPLKKDKFYIAFIIVFWLIWTPATAYVTWLAIQEFSIFHLIWLVFGYIGVILLPLSLLGAKGREKIIISNSRIKVEYDHGIFKSTVSIEKDNLESVTLEQHVFSPPSFGESGQECVWTLNVFQKRRWRWKRVMIASLAHPEEKNRIYADLVGTLLKFGFLFQQKNDYEYKPNTILEPSR